MTEKTVSPAISQEFSQEDLQKCNSNYGSTLPTITCDKIHQVQLLDPAINILMEAKKSSQNIPVWDSLLQKSNTFKFYWADWDHLVVKEGMLHRIWFLANGKNQLQLVVTHKLMDWVPERSTWFPCSRSSRSTPDHYAGSTHILLGWLCSWCLQLV